MISTDFQFFVGKLLLSLWQLKSLWEKQGFCLPGDRHWVVVFSIWRGVEPHAVLICGRICWNYCSISLFRHEFYVVHIHLAAGRLLPGVFLHFRSRSCSPATLKPEPHQRDPYDWNARHEAVKRRNREVKPEYVMIGDSITHTGAASLRRQREKRGGFMEEIVRPPQGDQHGLRIRLRG